MKRFGTVLVFREGVSKDEAAKALASIKDVLDIPRKSTDLVPAGRGRMTYKDRPFKFEDKVHEFNEEYGGPVWYIP